MTTSLAPELAALFAKRPQLIKPGLARIEAALAHLGAESLLERPCVLIAGTNGKGSTAGLLWSMLRGLGLKCGLFTSPHLLHFAERIQVSGQLVDDALLIAELGALRRELPAQIYEPMSFFEVNTLLALRLFRSVGTDLDVLEVGLGGRWDSTNVSRPLVSVITSIGLDHMEFLGPTSVAIAREKAGILRAGRPAVWGGALDGDSAVNQVIADVAGELGAPLAVRGRDFGNSDAELFVRAKDGQTISLKNPVRVQGWPPFLKANLGSAVATLAALLQDEALAPLWRRTKTESLAEGLARGLAALDDPVAPVPASLVARFDRRTVLGGDGQPRSVLLDVCHNVPGAEALVQGLRATGLCPPGVTLPGYVSVLGDKDHQGVLRVLSQVLNPMVLFASSSERSWRQADLGEEARGLPFYHSFQAAWHQSPPPSGAGHSGPAVICGSVHAVGEVCDELGLSPLASAHAMIGP